jgi:hypothetical protein
LPTSWSWWRIGRAEVAPPSPAFWFVHLEHVLEVEQLAGPCAVVGQAVERRQQRGASFEWLAERLGIYAPRSADALDRRRLAHIAHDVRFEGDGGPSRAGDAQRAQTPFVPDPARLVGGYDGYVRRVHARGQIPHALAPEATRDGDLAADHEELQHLRDVAVVCPPRRRPGDHTGVRNVAREDRPRCPEPIQDVASESIIGPQPLPSALAGGRCLHIREVEAKVAHRPDHRVVLEERPVLFECLLQLGRPVRRSEATPGDQVRAGRDRGRRIELQECKPVHDRQQVGWSRSIQQLGADRDTPRLREIESMGGHVASIQSGAPTDGSGGR